MQATRRELTEVVIHDGSDSQVHKKREYCLGIDARYLFELRFVKSTQSKRAVSGITFAKPHSLGYTQTAARIRHFLRSSTRFSGLLNSPFTSYLCLMVTSDHLLNEGLVSSIESISYIKEWSRSSILLVFSTIPFVYNISTTSLSVTD